MKTIECRDCKVVVESKAPTQWYCEICSTKRDLIRKKLWAREHPRTGEAIEKVKAYVEHVKALSKKAGALDNLDAKKSIIWDGFTRPDILWLVRVAVPFSYAASKNHLYTSRGTGHVALRREARVIRDHLTLKLKEAMANQRVAHNKVWLDILVQKPNHKGDAVNIVDLVCDAVKAAIPVDDRWFCIRILDWEIAKENPMLFIGVSQDSDVDCQVCSYCGAIKPFTEFGKRKQSLTGTSRECKECRSKGTKLAAIERQHKRKIDSVEPSEKETKS